MYPTFPGARALWTLTQLSRQLRVLRVDREGIHILSWTLIPLLVHGLNTVYRQRNEQAFCEFTALTGWRQLKLFPYKKEESKNQKYNFL